MEINIYCDGAVSGNGQQITYGGVGVVIFEKGKENELIKIDKGYNNTTNQRMELTAAIIGCMEAEKKNLEPTDVVNVYSDSAYLINCYNQKWYEKWLKNGWVNSKREPVKNKELWEKLIKYFETSNFKFHKVKGHHTDKYNNLADALAVIGRQKQATKEGRQ